MAFQKMFCAEPGCRWHTESKGGHFNYSAERKGFYCEDCFNAPPPVLNPGKELWHYATTHFNGERIEIKDGAHLDRLCRQFGVSNQARENMESHWNDAPSSRPEPMNPELARFLGKAREMGQMDRGSRVSGEFGDRR
jgi:hypothetical protein